MDTKIKRHAIFTGHIAGSLNENLEEKLPEIFIPSCPHDSYCFKLQTMPKAHCSEDYMKVCGQVKRFYDKWGEQGNQLGVGC